MSPAQISIIQEIFSEHEIKFITNYEKPTSKHPYSVTPVDVFGNRMQHEIWLNENFGFVLRQVSHVIKEHTMSKVRKSIGLNE